MSTIGMILAAGLGTRLKPWTDHHPKALAMVNGKSLLQRNIEYLQHNGVTEVVVNVHHFAEQIIDTVAQNNGWGSTVHISNESDVVLETGGGIVKAAPLFKNATHIAVMNADILTNLNLSKVIEVQQKISAKHGLALLAVTQRESSRNLLFDNTLTLCGWRNNITGEEKIPVPKNDLKPYAFSGIQVLESAILEQIPYTGKFSMIDVYLHLAHTQKILGYNHTGDIVQDVGKPENVLKAESIFK
jgi:NDP-sugar pyrophosphorylase family protein